MKCWYYWMLTRLGVKQSKHTTCLFDKFSWITLFYFLNIRVNTLCSVKLIIHANVYYIFWILQNGEKSKLIHVCTVKMTKICLMGFCSLRPRPFCPLPLAAIWSSYIWSYVNSAIDHSILQPNGPLPFRPLAFGPMSIRPLTT